MFVGCSVGDTYEVVGYIDLEYKINSLCTVIVAFNACTPHKSCRMKSEED